MSDEAILSSIAEGRGLKGHEAEVREELLKHPRSIVILDDDPTGTQTVHDVPVITEWTEEIIEKELLISPVFFILTNSRSLQANDADALATLIGRRLQKMAQRHHKELLVISRSDSTLRGHYPNEVNALAEGLGWTNAKQALIPAFFAGGRYTFNNIHYVQDGETFVRASKTPFAKDNTFGYHTADLREWIEEKTQGGTKSHEVGCIEIDALRNQSPEKIKSFLEREEYHHFVVNATSHADLQAFALACLQYEGHLIYRTAASFVNAISGIAPKPCLSKKEILEKDQAHGALMVVGSYVPKTTAQLNYLKAHSNAVFLELDVAQILENANFTIETENLAEQIDVHIGSGKNVVVYTSRKVRKGNSKAESLDIVNQVSRALIIIVKKLGNRPSYILAKGGITSSDIATKALQVQRANIMGQVIDGVPVWQLGTEAKFPQLPYIVFPGNVGDESAMYQVIKLLE